MRRHGSETFFVLGEGLLGEGRGGRDRTLAAADEALVPPFRFSRMGPRGTGRQLSEANRERIAIAMTMGAVGSRRSRLASPTWGSSWTTTSPST